VRRVPVADAVIEYAVRLARLSRPIDTGSPDFIKQYVAYGTSVRAPQALILGGKARALLQGRAHVSIDDIKALAPAVFRHRVLLNFQAQSERVTTDHLIERLLATTPTPRSGLG
jgi:MoxR-like ATPase